MCCPAGCCMYCPAGCCMYCPADGLVMGASGGRVGIVTAIVRRSSSSSSVYRTETNTITEAYNFYITYVFLRALPKHGVRVLH